MFHHHPDGLVRIQAAADTYAATLADFAQDLAACGLPAYAGLPEGASERRYTAGRHLLGYGLQGFEDAEPWTEGEAYLAAVPALLAAQAAREAPLVPSLVEVKARAKVAIDAAAEAARLHYSTPGSGQAMVYQQKAAEARALTAVLVAGGTPDPAATPHLAAEVGITLSLAGAPAAGMEEVAQVVLAMEAAWRQASAAIEAVRLAAKRDVDAAGDAAALQAVLEAIAWPGP